MSYTIDEENLERQQLLAMILEPATKQLLDALKLAPGSCCLDLGCGIGETTRLIAGSLGPQGEWRSNGLIAHQSATSHPDIVSTLRH
jgi:hypothetical protein